MEKQLRIESILSVMRTKLESYIDQESSITDPIDYEDNLLDIGQQFSLEVLQSSLDKVPKSRNKKKDFDQVGSR